MKTIKETMIPKKIDHVLGIGNDIIEIKRIRQSFAKHGARLLARLFSQKEQQYCLKYKDPLPHFAGRFAAKEAIVKALGTGIGKKISWLDIEILNEESGKPCVHFSKTLSEELKGSRVLISISHCDLYASCVALWIQ